jgi:ribosome-binding protein aMBF1 (putative translation factor)
MKNVCVAFNSQGLRIGETHPRSTIPDETVDRVREYREEQGKSYGWLALRFRLSYNTVKKICRYERRAQTPVSWKRVKT